MQKLCCQVFGGGIFIAVMVIFLSLWHNQSASGQFWSHRCYSKKMVENDLEGCKDALKFFEGIEVDVCWNGIEVWNNESFWLHHDDAALSTTKLVDLLEVMKNAYNKKYLYLDCKFKDIDAEKLSMVTDHFISTVDSFNLQPSNVVIEWNTKIRHGPYRTISVQDDAHMWIATTWSYLVAYVLSFKQTDTVVFTKSATALYSLSWADNIWYHLFNFWLWFAPCLPYAYFDAGADVFLWDDLSPPKTCDGIYTSLFAWKWLFYTIILGLFMQCIVTVLALVRQRDQYIYVPL